MKNLIAILFIIGSSIFAQEATKSNFFSTREFGVYGGLNLNKFSNVYGSVYFEGKTNLSENINIKLSVGYCRVFSFDQYTVNGYKYHNFGENRQYHVFSYDVLKTKYDIVPLSLGLQYVFTHDVFSPYVFFDASYNFIDPLTYKTPESVKENGYDTYEEIPAMYKSSNHLPNSSFGITFGVGTTYKLFSKIGLDLRYQFKYDNEIPDTHQLLIGILF